MKELLLVRHAKSSWDNPAVTDHNRPLNSRGRADAPQMGQRLRAEAIMPDLIISSTAKRARQTAEAIAAELGYELERIASEPNFYEADPDDYLTRLARLDERHQLVMVVGHNPGLSDLLSELTGRPDNMTTGNIAHLRLPLDHWPAITTTDTAELLALWRPRDEN